MNTAARPVRRERAGTRSLAPAPLPGSELPRAPTSPSGSPRSPLCSPYPQLSLAMVLDARDTVGPVAGRPRQGAGRAWVEGGAARTRSLGTRNRRGTVVTLRGRPSGERDLCFSNQKKVSNGGFPAFWEVHPEKALLEMTHPGRSCWLALEISSGKAGDPDGGGSGDYALTHFDADSGNNHHLKYQLLVRKCSPPRGQPSLPPQLHPLQSALLISPIPFLLTPASCRIGPA